LPNCVEQSSTPGGTRLLQARESHGGDSDPLTSDAHRGILNGDKPANLPGHAGYQIRVRAQPQERQHLLGAAQSLAASALRRTLTSRIRKSASSSIGMRWRKPLPSSFLHSGSSKLYPDSHTGHSLDGYAQGP
jgi:hypothetical protein